MFQDGQVSGSSGCNRFHGPFTAEENALTIHPLATTLGVTPADSLASGLPVYVPGSGVRDT